jgi:hypothetical protein
MEAAVFALTVIVGVGVVPGKPDSCGLSVVGVGVQHANRVDGAFFGRSLAQVFVATDTLVHAITVWRQPDINELHVPMHLFIGEMDVTDPLRPQPETVLLDGPTLVLKGTSAEPRPVRYELAPPFALPSPGTFYFAVKEDWCDAAFGLMSDSTGSYAGGDAWEILPYLSCDGLGNQVHTMRGIDLVFEVEFCARAVETREQTWGRVKSTYR